MSKCPTVFWDFDRTLAHRPPKSRGLLLEILDEFEPGCSIEMKQLRPYLESKFPWHEADKPHPELSDPQVWWAKVENIFFEAYKEVGIEPQRARKYAGLVRNRYTDPKGFVLYDDTLKTLHDLSVLGWNHYILSNHMPELPDIVKGLGLSKIVKDCITSASIGYEKPHPQAFKIALARADYPEKVWMVGDNLIADVLGAEKLSIPAILVHNTEKAPIRYQAMDLYEAAQIIDSRLC